MAENCPICHANLALVGRVHRCVPRENQPNAITKAAMAEAETGKLKKLATVAELMKDLGSKGGKSKSPAKQTAARANGKKGGKPKQNPSRLG